MLQRIALCLPILLTACVSGGDDFVEAQNAVDGKRAAAASPGALLPNRA